MPQSTQRATANGNKIEACGGDAVASSISSLQPDELGVLIDIATPRVGPVRNHSLHMKPEPWLTSFVSGGWLTSSLSFLKSTLKQSFLPSSLLRWITGTQLDFGVRRSSTKRLQWVQNDATRLLTATRKCGEHVTPTLASFHWLIFEDPIICFLILKRPGPTPSVPQVCGPDTIRAI